MVVVAVAEEVEVEEDRVEEVVAVPEFVETTSPSSDVSNLQLFRRESIDILLSRTTPIFLLQHEGSLSQQKLPSGHFVTRGRMPLFFSVNPNQSLIIFQCLAELTYHRDTTPSIHHYSTDTSYKRA